MELTLRGLLTVAALCQSSASAFLLVMGSEKKKKTAVENSNASHGQMTRVTGIYNLAIGAFQAMKGGEEGEEEHWM